MFTDENPTSGKTKYRLKQIDFEGKYEFSEEVEVDMNAPEIFSLKRNFPNPFNPETVISYQLPVSGNVQLRVFDLLGREVAELVNEEKAAGRYDVRFDGSKLTSGVYLYQLRAGLFVDTKKLVLLK